MRGHDAYYGLPSNWPRLDSFHDAVRRRNKDYAAGVFHRILKRAELPHYRVYDLRHTFASLLLAESAPITYVAAQLGHSSPATTMRFYARWIPSKGQRWVDALDRKPGGRTRQSAAGAGGEKWNQKVEPARGALDGTSPGA